MISFHYTRFLPRIDIQNAFSLEQSKTITRFIMDYLQKYMGLFKCIERLIRLASCELQKPDIFP